jgi:hypothetical protein
MTTTNERKAILAKLAKGEVPTMAEIAVLNEITAEAVAENERLDNEGKLKEFVTGLTEKLSNGKLTAVELHDLLIAEAANVPGLPVPEAPAKKKSSGGGILPKSVKKESKLAFTITTLQKAGEKGTTAENVIEAFTKKYATPENKAGMVGLCKGHLRLLKNADKLGMTDDKKIRLIGEIAIS